MSYNTRKMQESILKAEEAEELAARIKQQWREYHVKQRQWRMDHRRWYEPRLKMWTNYELDALVNESCKTDWEYKNATAANSWYIQQAQMYAAAAALEASSSVVVTPAPQQRGVIDGSVRNPGVRQQQGS